MVKYQNMENLYDLVIIGAGPAGITAGIYAAREGLKTLLVAKAFGGQMARKTVEIENYTGFENISGLELIQKFEKHLRKQKVEIKNTEISKIEKTREIFTLFAKEGDFKSKAVIVASGASPRALGIPGEKEFLGRGVSYCVACDGPMFNQKTVAIIGGGNAGFEAALFMETYAKKIYILEFGVQARANNILQEKAKNDPKIEVLCNASLKEIRGEKFVNSIIYSDLKDGSKKELAVQGVFIEIGSQPAVSFLNDLAGLNEKKEIIVDPRDNQTKTVGLFAAGDVTCVLQKQIIISAGDGAKAAISAYNYIKRIFF
jgi:NADH-dependent peroxiredoxin subunit F